MLQTPSRLSLPRRVAATLALAGAAFLLAGCGGGSDAVAAGVRPPATAVLADGSVQAVDRPGLRSYFAIPYAAPPVGDLRWRPPAAPARWTTPLARTASAAPCIQTGSGPFALAGGREDCLYLDVHAPDQAAGPYPVVVWLHGGEFNTGGAAAFQDPSPLVGQGLVVVNVAYRLGAYGFLAHPALRDANGRSGNWGLLDQQAALRWVRDNIRAFGGDPANVTLMGESAGGLGVLTHLASPLAKGLFHQAVVQGGAYGLDRQMPLATAEGYGAAIINSSLPAEGVRCPVWDPACVRGIALAVAEAVNAQFHGQLPSPVPVVDGHLLPKSIQATFAAGEQHRVPLLLGSNEDAYSLFLAVAEQARRSVGVPPNAEPASTAFLLPAANYALTLETLAAGTGVATPALVNSAYPLAKFGGATDPFAATRGVIAAGTDRVYACPAWQVARRVQGQGAPVWLYEFRDQTAAPLVGVDASGSAIIATPQGAALSAELSAFFQLREARSQEQRELRAAMARYWGHFARAGDPNGAGLPAWPRFQGAEVLGLDVASAGGIAPLAAGAFVAAHQCGSTWATITF